MIPLPIRKEMIDRDKGAMSVCNQCELLGLARSTLYYTPSKASDKGLKMMEDLDRLLFKCEVVKLSGKSYRLENRKTIFENIVL